MKCYLIFNYQLHLLKKKEKTAFEVKLDELALPQNMTHVKEACFHSIAW